MKKPTKGLDSAVNRFCLGFFMGASVAFLYVLLASGGQDFGGDLKAACVASPISGIVVGALSSFGKKILQFFIAFFTQMTP